MKSLYTLLTLILFVFNSCQKDITPAWLKVDGIDFTTNVSIEGESSHDIVDAWVYIDNKSMGIWDIPFKMPVLEEGEHDLIIYAGIKNNGISDSRTFYTFYTKYSTTIYLEKEKITQIKPTFKYKSVANFKGRENFEDTGTILNPNSGDDSTKIEIISKSDFPEIVKYGNNCGRIQLNKADTAIKIYTELNFPIIKNKTYLEFDYLSTNSFTIGISNISNGVKKAQSPFAGVKATKSEKFEWKKIYLDLTNEINKNTAATNFEYYIYGLLDNDISKGVIYIDNLKIVTF